MKKSNKNMKKSNENMKKKVLKLEKSNENIMKFIERTKLKEEEQKKKRILGEFIYAIERAIIYECLGKSRESRSKKLKDIIKGLKDKTILKNPLKDKSGNPISIGELESLAMTIQDIKDLRMGTDVHPEKDVGEPMVTEKKLGNYLELFFGKDEYYNDYKNDFKLLLEVRKNLNPSFIKKNLLEYD